METDQIHAGNSICYQNKYSQPICGTASTKSFDSSHLILVNTDVGHYVFWTYFKNYIEDKIGGKVTTEID